MAIIARNLWDNRELTHWLTTTPLLDLQYHGLDHIDYSKLSAQECYDQLKEGKEYLEYKLQRPVRVFYPPWNIEDQMVRDVCDKLGLEYDNRRIEARDYLAGGVGERVNLHYWQDQDIIDEVLAKEKKSVARQTFHKNICQLMGTNSILHVGKTHVYDYRAYFPWAILKELDHNPELKPDIASSIENVNLPSNSFETIICFGVLDVVKNKKAAVNEMFRLLRPDGQALIGFPEDERTTGLHKEIERIFNVIEKEVSVENDMKSFPGNSERYHHYKVTK